MSKGLLIFICIVLVVAFSVAYIELHKKWEYERASRITYELFYAASQKDMQYYQDLYYDCLNGE